MEASFCWISDFKPEKDVWVLENLICPTLSIWSGEPKMGKSMLAGHAVSALINNVELLGFKPDSQEHKVAWMGFDPGWKEELFRRWNDRAQNKILMCNAIRNSSKSEWMQLARTLKSEGITLLVIDHLYGMSGSLNLNDADEVYRVFELIRPLYEDFGIAVILIHQASKGFMNKGRAANSVAIEGEARHLVRIHSRRMKDRKLTIVSNQGEGLELSILLDDSNCLLREKKTNAEKNYQDRNAAPEAYTFMTSAKPEELESGWSGAGRGLLRLRLSSTKEGGRQKAKRWGEQGLLKLRNDSQVIQGPSLEYWIQNVKESNE